MTRFDNQAIHCLFELQAARTPTAIALRCGQDAITYRQLELRSTELAARMRSSRIVAGSVVALHMERSIEYVIALLATFKARCIALPLPTTYPPQRLTEILAFAAPSAVVGVDLSLTMNAPPTAEDAVSRNDLPEWTGEPDSSRSPAIILCSSGSTGTPKLIVRNHRSFYHRLNWTWSKHPYESDDSCCQKSFITTTHAVYELFEPLLKGVPVTIIQDPDVRDLERFWQLIRANSISRLLIVPSMLRASLDFPDFQPPSLKVLILMGEHLPSKLAERVVNAFAPGTAIYSIYGSTEASSTLVCNVREAFQPGTELPLGTPISPDVHACVLDGDGLAASEGKTGILHIAGPALFDEYFKAPQATTAVLSESRHGTGQLYNTMDQVRLSPGGVFHFLGRMDHVVKVRGYRVDLDEVEQAILAHPQVTQCAVVAAKDAGTHAAMTAFFTPSTVDQQSLRPFLAARLPDYMIPTRLVAVAALPLTPSGKVDRARLLEEQRLHGDAREATSPLPPTQEAILSAYKDVLQHSDFHPTSSFFEVGGTSLSVFVLVHRLRTEFGLQRNQLTEKTIYQYPSVEMLAGFIDRTSSGARGPQMEQDAILVTLKGGHDPSHPPLFVIASAGGTLGAYDRLAKLLKTSREVVGVRDPFIWGERDPLAGFDHWVQLYMDAIVRRQPTGPLHILAYSSAGAFAFELAKRIQKAGREMALLTLVDPLVLDSSSRGRFGYWVHQALFRGAKFRYAIVQAARSLRPIVRFLSWCNASSEQKHSKLPGASFQAMVEQSKTNKLQISSLSALLQLNTGLPVELSDAELSAVHPSQYLDVLLERVKKVLPHVDGSSIENVLVQYHCLQIPAQRAYRLGYLDCRVHLFAPEGPAADLSAALLGPYSRRLSSVALPVGIPDRPDSAYLTGLTPALRKHYLCMRDDVFVQRL